MVGAGLGSKVPNWNSNTFHWFRTLARGDMGLAAFNWELAWLGCYWNALPNRKRGKTGLHSCEGITNTVSKESPWRVLSFGIAIKAIGDATLIEKVWTRKFQHAISRQPAATSQWTRCQTKALNVSHLFVLCNKSPKLLFVHRKSLGNNPWETLKDHISAGYGSFDEFETDSLSTQCDLQCIRIWKRLTWQFLRKSPLGKTVNSGNLFRFQLLQATVSYQSCSRFWMEAMSSTNAWPK